jgi:hypothetical protein
MLVEGECLNKKPMYIPKEGQVHNGITIRLGRLPLKIVFSIVENGLVKSCQLMATPSFFDHFDRPSRICASRV